MEKNSPNTSTTETATAKKPLKRALFIDRDGTLVVEPPIDYQLDSLEKFKFIPGMIRNMAFIARTLDFELVMVTNQDGLGTPSFPTEDFEPPHRLLLDTLRGEGVTFDDIVIDKTFEHEHAPTRKPGIALLGKYTTGDYDIAGSFVIGDRLTDVLLARNLGAKAIFFSDAISTKTPDSMHPLMMLYLVAVCYLQSIFPLSIPMPAFLQWRRMWEYASPAIVLIVLYVVGMLFGGKQVTLQTADDLWRNIFNIGVLLRLASLGLSLYYIANIFRLPHRLARHSNVPRYMIGYCVALGISVLYYCVCTIHYNITMMMIYVIIFTLLNLYLAFRTLETTALTLPKPVIQEVSAEPAPEEVEKAEKEDFNEANLLRFQRIQSWMQDHKEEWKDNTFGRDRLCEAVGYNRHLVLQSVRSQGFYNTHEYINSFRIAELKRMVRHGEEREPAEGVREGVYDNAEQP